MELTELRNKIIASFSGSQSDLADVLTMVEEDQAIFPFNEYEHLICGLIDKGGMSYNRGADKKTRRSVSVFSPLSGKSDILNL